MDLSRVAYVIGQENTAKLQTSFATRYPDVAHKNMSARNHMINAVISINLLISLQILYIWHVGCKVCVKRLYKK